MFFPYHAVKTYHTTWCFSHIPYHQHILYSIPPRLFHSVFQAVKYHHIMYQVPTYDITPSTHEESTSLNSRCCPLRQTAAEQSMSWMVTQLQLYRVVASRQTRGPRAARLSVARQQQLARVWAWRPREAHSTRTSRWIRTRIDYSSSSRTAATPPAASSVTL